MAYDWEHAGESGRAGPLAEGEHTLTVVKIITEKNGIAYQSQAGAPQILLVLRDEIGGEGTDMITLSDAAAWTLARYFSAMDTGINAELKQVGIEPVQLADHATATDWLCTKGTPFQARVVYEDGSKYADITPIKPPPPPAGHEPVAPLPESEDDDSGIPF